MTSRSEPYQSSCRHHDVTPYNGCSIKLLNDRQGHGRAKDVFMSLIHKSRDDLDIEDVCRKFRRMLMEEAIFSCFLLAWLSHIVACLGL